MTAYENPSFSVGQRGRDPKECGHGWIRPNGECQFCGTPVPDEYECAHGSTLSRRLPFVHCAKCLLERLNGSPPEA